METLIVYHSLKGKTKKFAEEIAKRASKVAGKVTVKSIEETTDQDIRSCDLLFLGSWTSGKFFFDQKPQQAWIDFAQKLPAAESKKTVLFTSYLISTGSMFRNMKQYLPKGYKVVGSMKSRTGLLDYFSFSTLKYSLNYVRIPKEGVIRQLAEVS